MHSFKSISIIDFSCCAWVSLPCNLTHDQITTNGLKKNKHLEAGNYKLTYAVSGVGEIVDYDRADSHRELTDFIKGLLDHRNLTSDVRPFSQDVVFSLENLAIYSFNQLCKKVKNLLYIELTDDIGEFKVRVNIDKSDSRNITLFYKFKILAAHILKNPKLSDLQNIEIYGKCNNKHGHEYVVELGINNKIQSRTNGEAYITTDSGMLWDRESLIELVNQSIIKKYNYSLLNDYMENTTGEIIISEFKKVINQQLELYKDIELSELLLRETQKNSFYLT